MTKTYTINGRKIEVEEIYSSLNELAFLELLKALSDKEEPKQEEWKPCTCPKGSTDCDKCDGVEWIKQSTSLKENLADYLTENMYDSSSEELAISILSLIQSHLVKEIEKTTEYKSPIANDWLYKKEDIIKIINNIN